MNEFFGKYRGKVVKNDDPLKLGRVQVTVPSVLGDVQIWAMPCVPYAGPGVGHFFIPPANAAVWIEFEEGRPEQPIWTGCFWEQEADVPAKLSDVADADKLKVLFTPGCELTLSNVDNSKKVELVVKDPLTKRTLKATFDDKGIELNNGDETIVRLTDQDIQLNTKDKSKATLTDADITLENQSVKLSMMSGSKTIQIENGSATTKMTTSEHTSSIGATSIKLQNAEAALAHSAGSTVSVAADAAEMKSGASNVKAGLSSLDLANGGASVKLAVVSVNVNNGALEVI